MFAVACASAPLSAPDSTQPAEEGPDFDPSDPTRIEARVGAGYKFTDYSNGASMNEARAKVAVDIGEGGTFIADVGVGALSGFPADDDLGLTDGRFRYFKLWDMDRTVVQGYRGWGTSFELQTQGTVPGTDGSNLLALGGLAAFGSGTKFSVFPNLIAMGIWGQDFDDYLGGAARFDLIMTFKPKDAWNGAYVKLKPSVSYGVSDVLEGESSLNIEAAVGGAFNESKTWWWDVQLRWFETNELEDDSSGSESNLAPESSIFLSLTHFF